MNRLLLLRRLSNIQLNSIPKSFCKPEISPLFSLSSFSAFLRQYSSSQSSSHSKPSEVQSSNDIPESSSIDDIPTDVTTQELKHRIDRYLKGDMEVLPSIFEGILARKLSGKHDDTDDELMEEFRSKTQQGEGHQFQSDEDLTESDSDEDLTESDEEPSD
ncbi:uncharacterized protein LOC110702943 [Chenopodium quinoa]|uniref:uncharacterized protein LOC110702943 n=1 Tax=Chenopodium quinoa TaxID=63459 RepID=UPI000B7707BE|nr:uncharacterized protein LOC110702943 [Chenopodium quinoa]